MNKKTKFTGADLENRLYDLATMATKKGTDTRKVNSAVGAYRAILQLQALKIKAAALGLRSETMDDRKTLQLTERKKP